MTVAEKSPIISAEDFALVGMQHVAYIRPTLVNGVTVMAIHAADGTPIGMAPTRDIAFAAVKQHELEPVSLH